MRVVAALIVLLALLLGGLNTPAGFRLLEAAAAIGGVHVAGLDGRFPDRLTADRIALDDAQGTWLEIHAARLDWSPIALIGGRLAAAEISARDITISRYPAGGSGSSGGGASLPDIDVARISIGTLKLPETSVSLDGAVRLVGDAVDAKLSVRAADAPGAGPIAGPVSLTASLSGPRTKATLAASLTGGGTRLTATGLLDLAALSGTLDVTTDPIAIEGVAVARTELHLSGSTTAAKLHATLTGLRLPGDRPDLLGPGAVTLDAAYGPDLSVDIATANARLHLQGPIPRARIAADWRLEVTDLAAFVPDLAGAASLTGTVAGTPDDLTVQTTLDAKLATGPVAGPVTVRGLPGAPVVHADLHGAWNGMAASLVAEASRNTAGVIHLDIVNAGFQGVQGEGKFDFDPKLGFPSGTAVLTAATLPAPATGGRVKATIDLAADRSARITAEASGLATSGISVARALLSATATELAGDPRIKATLTASDLRAGGVTSSGRLEAEGVASALGLRLTATGPMPLQAAGTVDVNTSRLTLTTGQVTTQGQTLRLAAPVRVDYAQGVTVDRLRLALGAATLELAGRLAPALDLTATLRNLPASLAKLADPTLDLQGALQANATLRGPPARPTGTLRVSATGLRLASAAAIPTTSITATAALNGVSARIDARVTAGSTGFTITGTAPEIPGGAYDLRAMGTASLALLDPTLAPSGRQARGTVALDATLTGTEPRPAGTLTLRGGSFVDAIQGLRLTDIAATLRADPGRVVLESLTARAGGVITAQGSLELDGARTLTGKLSARDIAPLSSDALAVRLSADLTASGSLDTGVAAGGTVTIARADIRIPERLPANLPTLALRQPGPPPPPPAPALPIGLDITLIAPSDIHVRGRGIDAELAGRLHIGGSAAAMKPDGGFTMRRGQLTLAGQTLNFTTGTVSFDGHLPIDPTLDFSARAQGTNVIATLAVTGTASHPRITLSSTPDLPQDEVLAQLLFRRSASSLSPFQIAQIAAGLAQLTDVGGAAAFDPLGRLRAGLGLDVLSVGGATGGRQTVEAGRNIARGVYVGAKQAAGGVGTQATVRLDLTKGLRLEADLGQAPPPAATTTPGAPPTGNQIGITYEFEY